MKIRQTLAVALVGWLMGIAAVLAFSWVWQVILPAILRPSHYDGIVPSLPIIFLIALIVASPAALIGGAFGSRVPREGGQTEQTLMAAIIGAVLALLFACSVLWVFTGY